MPQPIDMNACEAVGNGARRPEDVAVSVDGAVWLSDQGGACAMIDDTGALARSGDAGGAPNGINFDLEGRIVIANFGGPDDGYGPLQRFDPATGEVETLVGEIDGRRLYGCNYPLVDSRGRIWCSHSTWDASVGLSGAGADDGFVFRLDPDGSVHVLAQGIRLANGIAMDYDEQHLFVCETTACDVLRYPIEDDGGLGAPERYGPVLGLDIPAMPDQRPLPVEWRSRLGLTDGCGFDVDGNLWVTLVMANKVVAITPEGEVVTMLDDPEGKLMRNPTNVSWGGDGLRDLYIGSITSDYVVKAPSPAPGMAQAYQRP